MSLETYDDEGLRFEYPSDWALEDSRSGDVRIVAAHAPDGLGFVVIQTDDSRPDPAEIADSTLQVMRDDYPDLDSRPVTETINDQDATGHDLEFVALDMTNAAAIRCFRTPRRTVLAFGQWSELGDAEASEQVRDVLRSVEESE